MCYSAGRAVPAIFLGAVLSGLGCSARPSSACPDSPAQQLLTEINRVRRVEGLPALMAELRLARVAEFHAVDLAGDGASGHLGGDGRGPNDRLDEEGVQYGLMGENVASGYDNAALVAEAWLQSPSHRGVLLHPRYRYVGIGVEEQTTRDWFWVAEFAALRDEPHLVRGGCHS